MLSLGETGSSGRETSPYCFFKVFCESTMTSTTKYHQVKKILKEEEVRSRDVKIFRQFALNSLFLPTFMLLLSSTFLFSHLPVFLSACTRVRIRKG